MKKILVSLMILCITQIGFANENINEAVLNAFNTTFTEAKEVSWEYGENYAKATFVINGHTQYAYYTPQGELMGVAEYIRISQLPESLKELIKKNYQSYWITDLFEVTREDEKNFYITIENADQTLILKNNGVFGWSIFKRAVK